MADPCSVWLLCHYDIEADVDEWEAEDPDDAIDFSYKRIGYYRSEAAARAAALRAAGHPRFKAFPGGFRVHGNHRLDDPGWSEGFHTYYYSIEGNPE